MSQKDKIYIYTVAKRALQGKADPGKALALILKKVESLIDWPG